MIRFCLLKQYANIKRKFVLTYTLIWAVLYNRSQLSLKQNQRVTGKNKSHCTCYRHCLISTFLQTVFTPGLPPCLVLINFIAIMPISILIIAKRSNFSNSFHFCQLGWWQIGLFWIWLSIQEFIIILLFLMLFRTSFQFDCIFTFFLLHLLYVSL